MLEVSSLGNGKGFLFSLFLVSWFQGFSVSEFLGFDDSQKHFNAFKRDFVHITIKAFRVFFVLLDIDLVSKIFKILFDGSVGLFGAHLFQTCQTFGFQKMLRFVEIIFAKNMSGDLEPLRYPGVSTNKKDWFRSSGTRSKIPKS